LSHSSNRRSPVARVASPNAARGISGVSRRGEGPTLRSHGALSRYARAAPSLPHRAHQVSHEPRAAPLPAVLPEPTNRIAVLDILRGFALAGMIFVHFHQEFRLTTEGIARLPGETSVGWIAWMVVEQKAWGTFAFLFGVGFAVLMRRAEQRGQPVVAFYLRRLAALAVMAIALDALTGFTVLLDYAMWGVPLLFIRKWPAPILLI